MIKKVGIPRALFYYQYYPMWKTFFEELGAEVVLSDNTTKKIMDDGVKSSVDEACLPIKIFHGHVVNLKDRVDYLFIPRFTSVSKNEYICPKFGGLPDMIRHTFKGLPQIIDTEVNLRKSRENALIAAFEVGSYFTRDRRRIKAAYKKALASYRDFRNQVKSGVLPGDILDKKLSVIRKKDDYRLNIAVVGHVYNLYDKYINMNMMDKLRNNGTNIITVDMVDSETINDKVRSLPKQIFWNFGRKAMGSSLHFLDRDDIDGIIYLMTFGCGVDSFICDLIERKIRRKRDIPFIALTLDEHSGEAGMDTRLEAFIDMIRWRYKNENNISAHG
ncbi:MAG: acyl-CoA dehydratase activase-related protein [Bacillota bacterium]